MTYRIALAAALLASASPAVAAAKALPIGECINLGNTLEVGGDRAWDADLVTTADIARIKAAGFKTVRIPVRWDDKSLDHPPYTVDPRWMARVDTVVNEALDAGLNVILNSHHFQPIYAKPLETQPWHTAVWRQIAAHFADRPTSRLWFEIENEPHDKFDDSNLRQVIDPALAVIRESNPDRPVIVGGEMWSGIKSLATLSLPDDPNVYPTFHYYDPFDFTHQGASWVAPNIPEVGRVYGTQADSDQLARDVATVKAYAARTGLVPFMGETGAYDRFIPLPQRVAYTKAVHDAFVPAGIAVCQWAYSNTFPFYDKAGGKWLPGMRGALGLADDAPPAAGEAAASEPSATGALAALDKEIPGHLVNDPTRIDWPTQGNMLKVKGIQDASIPGGQAARRYTVQSKPANAWEAQTSVPLTAKIARGQTMTIGFYARTLSAETSDGMGVIGVRFQQNAAPYPGFADTTLKIGPDWKWYEVSGVADRSIDRDVAIVSLQLGGAKQEVEIGQTIVVEGAPSIANTTRVTTAPEPQVPDPLKGAGKLLNRPDVRDWANTGAGGTSEVRDDTTIWLGKATRYTTTQVGANPWDLGTSIPIDGAIAEGDTLLIAIAARTESAATPDGKALVGVRIQGTVPPYDGFADNTFKVGPNWQLIRIKTTATRAFAPGEATLTLHFAREVQAVDIGPVYVFKAQ